MSVVKIDVEKFDRVMHLGVWQEQVSDVLIQPGLHKALKGRLSGDTSEKLSIDSSPLAVLAKVQKRLA